MLLTHQQRHQQQQQQQQQQQCLTTQMRSINPLSLCIYIRRIYSRLSPPS